MSLDFVAGALLSAFIALVVASARVITPSIRRRRQQRMKGIVRVLIYGAGSAGLLALDEIEQCRGKEAYAIGFIDDNLELKGRVRGSP